MSLFLPTKRPLLMGYHPNLRRGLVASYGLSEASGTRYDSVSPGIGPAAQFTSANSESLSRAAALFTSGSWSIAGWIYRTAGANAIPFAQGTAAATLNSISADTNGLLTASLDGGVTTSTATTTIAAATWYHVALVYDGTVQHVYVNGVDEDNDAVTPDYTGVNRYRLGANAQAATFSDGRQQATGAWSKALSTAEVVSLYNGGRGLAYRDLSGTLTTSLTSWWDLSEPAGTRKDSHGSNDLTDNNTVTQAVGVAGGNSLGAGAAPGNAAGKIGNAVQFVAASSQYLATPDNADLSMGDIDFTIAAWVYLDSKATAQGFLGKVGTTGANGTVEYHGFYSSVADRFKFAVSDGTNYGEAIADNLGAVSTATWYLIVAWHDFAANTINIQINNGAVDSTAWTTGSQNTANAFAVGRPGGYDGSYTDGRIDAVHIWKNRILTAAERTALYNGGLGREYPLVA